MRKGSYSEELVKIVVPKTAQLSEPNSIDNSSIQKTTSYSETSSHPRRCAVTHSTARIPLRCSPGIQGMQRRSPWTARLIKVLFDFSGGDHSKCLAERRTNLFVWESGAHRKSFQRPIGAERVCKRQHRVCSDVVALQHEHREMFGLR